MSGIDQLKFFERKLYIDKENLDNEVAELPSLFYTVSDHYLEALKWRKRIEERLNRQGNSIIAAIRSAYEAESSNPRGLTETRLKQEVALHPAYRKLKAKLNQAIFVMDRWAALKDAYIQKSFSLKGLVSLSVHENFQNSSVREPETARGQKKARGNRRGSRRKQ